MTNPPERLQAALSSRYRIERELGQGGMATVYLAEDLKHKRKVALKVLKPELAAVLGAERFVQEITTTASLQHPHILPLFDSGTADGFLYYVMPFIQGETLREKLNRETQLGVDEAVKIATDVADALHYAHTQGVIHRDIKPENILLANGRPMVADFGIALAVSAAAGGRMTETGLSLGTPHYMSPEQATAEKEITARSDVYSLASVLYEMLAGVPPHEGGSAQQTIMRIIADTPRPVSELRKAVPPNVAAAVARALEKLPADRFESAARFAEALGNPGYTHGSHSRIAARASGRRSVSIPTLVGVTLLAIVASAAATAWIDSRSAEQPVTVKFEFSAGSGLPLGGTIGSNVAVSPDGLLIVYSAVDSLGRRRLFARALGEAATTVLPGAEGGATPFFSPDGLWLGFARGNQLFKMPVEGGTPTPLAGVSSLRGGSWGPRGIVVSSGSRLKLVPVDGGTPGPLAPGDTTRGFWPVVLPGGRFVVHASILLDNGQLRITDLSTGRTADVGVEGSYPVGIAGNDLVFARQDGALMAAPFDSRAGRVTGSARVVVPDVLTNRATGESKVGLSLNGTLTYLTGTSLVQVVESDLRGGMRQLPMPPGAFRSPRYSPDGRRLAVEAISDGRTDIYLYDIASGAVRRVTSEGTQNTRPEWSWNGERLLYRTDRVGADGTLWWLPVDASEAAVQLTASPGRNIWQGVLSPDGNHVVYRTGTVGEADLRYRRVTGDTTEHGIATSRFNEFAPSFSPDGRWITYMSDESGSNEVYVRPFPGPGAEIPVSVGGGVNPVWSRDGGRIFFTNVAPSGSQMLAATVTVSPTFKVTRQETLFAGDFVSGGGHATFDVSREGQSILMLRPVPGKGEQVVVVYNWAATLRAGAQGRTSR